MEVMMSCLSELPDGAGFYYGFLPGTTIRIDVRRGPVDLNWRAYVAGQRIGDVFESKAKAESAAVAAASEERDHAMKTYRIVWRAHGVTDIEAITEKDAMKAFDKMAVGDYAERDYTNLEREKAVAVEPQRRDLYGLKGQKTTSTS